ncbi:hypothetical protein [Paracoccus homiensis]|uniref:Uncharacterized protein n=1 Tax=Paracoccus homiensis TaxID=364199 RepID=A0A1I0APN6_9RHOB|nr:hypothetical protein [Paracoccus homiensis]SES96233.1 hypothetical protein SAMN04489858_102316 [Paracoccus homiensis]
MRRPHDLAALILGLVLSAPAWAGEAGDAVFAERGPWALGDQVLTYRMQVQGPQVDGFLPVADGSLQLAETIDPSDNQPVLQVVQKTDDRSRKIGPFPVSGGDPVLTFFLEQTTRDMAALTGGSPFYIRNRIKDAVFRGGDITPDQNGRTARFQPFADDPNAERMHGFQTLTLTFHLDDDPARPIREMRARTQGETPGYDRHMVLK